MSWREIFLGMMILAVMTGAQTAMGGDDALVSDGLCHGPGALPNKQLDDLYPFIAQVTIDQSDVCTLSLAGKSVKNVVILFEGYQGYTDAVGEGFRRFEALQPRCEGGKVIFADGHAMDFNRVVGQIHDMVQDGGGSPVALKSYILNGMCKTGAMSFQDTEVFYFPEYMDLQKAKNCVDRTVRRSYGKNAQGAALYPTLSVLGYSYGGNAALNFAKLLDQAGYKIDLGMTVDPVGRGC